MSCEKACRDLQVDAHRGVCVCVLMGEGGRTRQRGNHVLTQWDNDVSKRDQAVKMGKCLSSSLKCPLSDPFR